MKRLMQLLLVAAITSGCAGIPVVKAPPTDVANAAGKPLTVVTYKKPDFVAFTSGKAAFAMIGAALMISEGNEVVAKNNIQDPALSIAKSLTPTVAERLKAAQGPTNAQGASDSIDDASVAAKNQGVVLDVATLGWQYIYFPTSWGKYRVTYTSRTRLIDAQTRKVIAQVPCTYSSDTEETAVSVDQLLANDAALLKQKLDLAATACADITLKNLF